MERFLAPYANQIYALMRIFVGVLFACHGAQKLLGMFGGFTAAPMNPLLYAAGTIELVGGLMVAAGVYASIAAFICSGQMAVGYFLAHQSRGLFPIQNQGELAVLYCFVFLYIAAKGPGIWSVDGSRGGD